MELSDKLAALFSEGRINVIQLTDSYVFKSFDCGNGDLNDFLFNDSKLYSRYLRYVTTLLETNERIIAYYSLANDLLTVRNVEDFREEIDTGMNIDDDYWERFYEQVHYPAVKIGRLAVDKEYQSMGLGRLIIDSLIVSFTNNSKSGCQFITVDAVNDHDRQRTIRFYEKNGFRLLTLQDLQKDSRLMYKPLIIGRI
ncbi:MAG: GNAT family N-acetyltransferase [Dysgonamonadaceae bacterium]|jgi:GNAT superfamily N-acetyltransferase|nr:GNAT family N-acetyltransferase [Dysgonamonadaceae bacterium]